MEPQLALETKATLVDLLDRILDKGLVIYADIIISVAGIPLIGVNLRAALAGMDTMIKYGVMQPWDEKSRIWEREHRKRVEPLLMQGEEMRERILGSCYRGKGIYVAWNYGYFYITNKRVFLWNKDFNEILFESPLNNIKGLAIREEPHFALGRREELYLVLRDGRVIRLHTRDIYSLRNAIEEAVKDSGIVLEENPVLPPVDEREISFVREGEMVTCRGRMWCLLDTKGRVDWKAGELYITNQRLCWWDDFTRKIAFQLPLSRLIGSTVGLRDLSPVLKKKIILDVLYAEGEKRNVVSFSGDALEEWKKVINGIVARGGKVVEEMESCPRCGQVGLAKELLEKGCSKCGWVSPRLEKIRPEA